MTTEKNMFKYALKYLPLIFVVILLSGCGNDRNSAKFIFMPVEIRERSIFVDSEKFPDEVVLFFCASDFAPSDAELTEIIGDRLDNIEFSAVRAIPESLDILVFIEDCSGSMKPRLRQTDRIIVELARQFGELNAAIVRVGKHPVIALESTRCSKLAQIQLDTLEYPSPKGTALADGFELANEIIGEQSGAIVLLADGSISRTVKLAEQTALASKRGIPVVALQMDGCESGALKSISKETNGFYAHHEVNSLAEILTGGWTVSYKPVAIDTNGAEHKIVLRWGAQKRLGAYKAPGTPPPRAPEPEPVLAEEINIPVQLIEGMRVPFVETGNVEILRAGREVLDSIVFMLDSYNIPVGAKLAVDGYTCNIGAENYNNSLSLRRAKIAANYIRQNCADGIQLIIDGHGEADPIMPNDSESNRKANRRVEIRLIMEEKEVEIFTSHPGKSMRKN